MREFAHRESRSHPVRWRAERLVADNRVTIAVVFPLVGALLLLASGFGLLPPWLAFNAWLVLGGVLVMRAPLLVALSALVDRRVGVALGLVTAYTYVIEYVGLTTGWPYGDFHYLAALGPTVAGVPPSLPLLFLPLVLNAYLLAVLLLEDLATSRPLRVASAIAVVLVVDLVLDPAAVALGLWTYGGGAFYGVPLSNYLGWLLSATVTVAVVDWGLDVDAVRERLAACPFALDDLVSFTLLWGVVNAVHGNWVPVLLAAGLLASLAHVERFDVAVPRWLLARSG